MIDEFELLDDPEVMRLDPEMSDFEFSGDVWEWVPEWELQNVYGANRELWGIDNPPLTTRLREKLHPTEVAYYEGQNVWKRLVAHASRKMDWSDKHGWTAEDVAQHAYEVVYPLGFEVGGASWVKLTRRVMNQKVADLLRKQDSRAETVVPDYPHDRSETPAFVPQVFGETYYGMLEASLTSRELEAVVWTYQEDLTNAQTAMKMKCSESTVSTLLGTAREKLESGGN